MLSKLWRDSLLLLFACRVSVLVWSAALVARLSVQSATSSRTTCWLFQSECLSCWKPRWVSAVSVPLLFVMLLLPELYSCCTQRHPRFFVFVFQCGSVLPKASWTAAVYLQNIRCLMAQVAENCPYKTRSWVSVLVGVDGFVSKPGGNWQCCVKTWWELTVLCQNLVEVGTVVSEPGESWQCRGKFQGVWHIPVGIDRVFLSSVHDFPWFETC